MKNPLKFLPFIFCFNLICIDCFSINQNAFLFKITGNGYSDETIIRLVNDATLNFDGMYDAWKLFSLNTNTPSIYTEINSGEELSINALPEFSQDVSINIFTNIPASGTYSLKIEELFKLSDNYKISLTDISSNTHYQIMGDTEIEFTLNSQQNTPTFTFNISTSVSSSIKNEICYNSKDGVLIVENKGNTNWNIKIRDENNNMLIDTISTSPNYIHNNLKQGNYSGQVTSKGIVDNFNFSILPAPNLTAAFNLNQDTIYLSDGGKIDIFNTSINAQNYHWDFGDGNQSNTKNPTHTYTTIGNYNISLKTTNTNCIKQNKKPLVVLTNPPIITNINPFQNKSMKLIYLRNGNYKITTPHLNTKKISIHDLQGRLISLNNFYEKDYLISLNKQPSGIYLLTLVTESGDHFQKKIIR